LRKSKATKAKETVTDRTDDLVAALDAAKEALARASAAAGRKGAELGKEATKAADKLLPERARQRRREAARRRNRKVLAGAAGLGGLLLVVSRLTRPKAGDATRDGGWDRVPETGQDAGPASSAEVTQLHGNGAGGDPARTTPS
jgi:hypothetical protein